MKKGIVSVVSTLGGTLLGASIAGKMEGDKRRKAQNMSNKHFELFTMMNQWVKVKQAGKNLSSFFKERGFNRIAIYGMSYAGETLLGELQGTGIEVAYGIDRNAGSLYSDINIVSMEDVLEEVDAVVVTAITFFDEIEENLEKKLSCPIISLEDVLYEI